MFLDSSAFITNGKSTSSPFSFSAFAFSSLYPSITLSGYSVICSPIVAFLFSCFNGSSTPS